MDNAQRSGQETTHTPPHTEPKTTPQGDRSKTKPATSQVPPAGSDDLNEESSLNRRNEGL